MPRLRVGLTRARPRGRRGRRPGADAAAFEWPRYFRGTTLESGAPALLPGPAVPGLAMKEGTE